MRQISSEPRQVRKEAAVVVRIVCCGYERMEVTDLQPAYAISVHKSQGSEYPVVIFPLLKQHFMMLQRNLVYTGLTRAKKKVIFVGDPAAYAMAIRNDKTLERHTDLIRKLKDFFQAGASE